MNTETLSQIEQAIKAACAGINDENLRAQIEHETQKRMLGDEKFLATMEVFATAKGAIQEAQQEMDDLRAENAMLRRQLQVVQDPLTPWHMMSEGSKRLARSTHAIGLLFVKYRNRSFLSSGKDIIEEIEARINKDYAMLGEAGMVKMIDEEQKDPPPADEPLDKFSRYFDMALNRERPNLRFFVEIDAGGDLWLYDARARNGRFFEMESGEFLDRLKAKPEWATEMDVKTAESIRLHFWPRNGATPRTI